MGKATKHWWPNQYIQLLVRDGILYFVVNLLNTVTFMIQSTESITISTAGMLFLFLFSYISMCTIIPRFIIGIRELYDRDHRARRCQGVDTGFGISSQPSGGEDRMEMSTIAFTDGASEGQIMERDADDAGPNQPAMSESGGLEGSQV
ncbi:hypothetical protein JVU11DRAFT_9867 [Chiua virens]|nr:hypothetical protein JVU11DRAFT_9867 [Chiua virens]